jgi:AcrR family transcriptional regulator
MSSTRTRKTAEQRREEVLAAAAREFADKGLHGASTELIARKAEISQPYLFRLFGTKKQLFMASLEQCFDKTYATFAAAAKGLRGRAALDAMGKAYTEMLESDSLYLRLQMQGYAACGDRDVRRVVRRGYRQLYELAGMASYRPPSELAAFFSKGMLLNVATMMDLAKDPTAWSLELLAGLERGTA